MSHVCIRLALAAGLLTGATAALSAGTVEVRYVQPENFSDVGRGAYDREHTLNAITGFLQTLGRRLPDGQTLRLEVTDIDLAGEIEPVRSFDLRVMRGRADWPHLKLNYELQTGTGTVKAGQADLADMNYLYSLRGFSLPSGELAYEKRMLQKWFDTTIVAP